MPLPVINTYERICGLFLHKQFDLNAWRAYAADISPRLAQKCEDDARGYDFTKEVAPVVYRQ